MDSLQLTAFHLNTTGTKEKNMKTAFVWHESYAWHNTGNAALIIPSDGKSIQSDTHAEDPETKRRFRNLLEMSGLYPQLTHILPRMATEADILRVHSIEHLENIKHLSANGGGETGILTVVGNGSYEIAMLSAGGLLAMIDAIMADEVDNGYALVRPPGHHATRNQAEGFCIFCNSAVAGRYLMDKYDLNRVAFVDWDVHHGNGTEEAFWDDDKGLTISTHQDRFYPADRGFVEQLGEGKGEGYNINIPLPPGSGVGAYVKAFEQVVIPALYKYHPEFIIVPSGFDASAFDPLGRMMMHTDGYRQITQMLMKAAEDLCDGRIMMCHEGGYSRAYTPFCGLAVVETLSGIRTDVEDPFLELAAGMGGQSLQPAQQDVIDQAEQVVNKYLK